MQPLVVFLGLSAALAYLNWAAFQAEHYEHLGYLSPLYSPELFGDSPHAWFGPQAGMVARLSSVLACVPDSLGTRRLSVDLLLLPRRVLQGVLGRSPLVRRR